MPPENLEKLKKKLQAIDEAVTLQDLEKAIEAVLSFSKNLENKTERTLEDIAQAVQGAITRIEDTADGAHKETTGKLQEKMEAIINEVNFAKESFLAEAQAKIDNLRDGEDGEDADEERIASSVLAKIPAPVQETAEKVRDKLESLIGEERLDVSAIKGIEDIVEKIKQLESRPVSVIGNSGRDIKDIDISDQLDGVTKTFNIPAVWKIVTVDLSSFPNALRKNIDYTWTPTTITFTDQIEASTSLNTGQTCIITAVTN